MVVYIGSARHDENGKYAGGKAGDQKQKIGSNGYDMSGEVSVQTLTSFVGTRAWYILRPKQAAHAKALAQAMLTACNNPHIGYDQTTSKNGRLGIVTYGVDSKVNTEADCSSTVRACAKKATGKDPGNFNTAGEVAALVATGFFDKPIVYRAGVQVYEGDVFVTQKKGHTGICIAGLDRVVKGNSSQIIGGKFLFRNFDMSPVFDPSYYKVGYPDVVASPNYGPSPEGLFKHFCEFGMKEGRQAHAEFNVTKYQARYPDLQKAYGNDLVEYYVHYVAFGKAEGREAI